MAGADEDFSSVSVFALVGGGEVFRVSNEVSQLVSHSSSSSLSAQFSLRSAFFSLFAPLVFASDGGVAASGGVVEEGSGVVEEGGVVEIGGGLDWGISFSSPSI